MLNLKNKPRCPRHPYNPLPAGEEECQVCIGERNAELDRKRPPRKATFKRTRGADLPEPTVESTSSEDTDEVLRIVRR